MNKTVLKIFVGIIALALAVCAAFFSIVGLSKLFAGAFIAVIAMATTLEASKLVIASFLYRTWSTVNKVLRTYLIIAITIIALITSIGIYGFLSGAYQTTKSKYELSKTASDSLSIKKAYYDNALISYKAQLESKNSQLQSLSAIRNSQEQRALTLVNSNKSSRSADKSAIKTDKSINSLNAEINKLNDSIVKFSTESAKLNSLNTQAGLKNEVSSELGSLTYISNVTGISMDTVVNILIILFMIVFDPLAICMVLAFNYLNTSSVDDAVDNSKLKASTSINDISVVEPEIVSNEPLFTEEDIDFEDHDFWDNLTDEEIDELTKDMITQERELIMDDIPMEQPQIPTVEDTNDSKPIEEDTQDEESQKKKEERSRQEEKIKKLQQSIGGAVH